MRIIGIWGDEMAELLDLSSIFDKKIFRIPDYQRGYAWQNSQLYDFWEDILNLQDDRDHYIGLISIKQIDVNSEKITDAEKKLGWLLNKNYKIFHIVDGQQRLTTFIILLNEIINFVQELPENRDKHPEEIIFDEDSISDIRSKYLIRKRRVENVPDAVAYLFDYEDTSDQSSKCLHKILDPSLGGEVLSSYYTRNLENARSFFAEAISKFYNSKSKQKSALEALYNKITCRLKFNLHKIEDNYNVFVAFETMNNRGKKLTNLELLKNRLIYLTTLFPRSTLDETQADTLRDEINDTWKEIYRQLGRNKKGLLSDDEFLRAHWIMYFQYSRNKKAAYITFLLNKFSHKSIFSTEKLESYSEYDVNDITDSFDDQEDSEDVVNKETTDTLVGLKPKEISDYVKSLGKVAQYWYYTFFPEDSPSLTDEEKLWLGKLNRIGVAYFRPLLAVSMIDDLKFSSEERLELFKAIERFIFIHFRMGGNASTFKSSTYYDKTRSVYREGLKLLSVIDDLKNTTDQNSKGAVAAFLTRIDRLFYDRDGFYTWGSIRYFLFEYEDSLHKKYRRGYELNWENFVSPSGDKISIEHILPQTPTLLYWRNNFRQFTKDEIRQLSSSLGNLLPLAQSINSSLQNDSFDDKKERDLGYHNGCHSEVEVAQEPVWDAQRIYARGMNLLNFMEDRWNFKFESKNQKEKLLHVTFVNDGRAIPGELTGEDVIFLCGKFVDQKVKQGGIYRGICDDTYVRFTTDAMNGVFPDAPTNSSGWGTKNYYYYEISYEDSKIEMCLAVSGKDIPDNLYEICERINDHFPFSKRLRSDFVYRHTLQTGTSDVSDSPSEEEVFGILNQQFEKLMTMEKQLVEKLGEES